MGILSLFQRKQKNTQAITKIMFLWVGQQIAFLINEENK